MRTSIVPFLCILLLLWTTSCLESGEEASSPPSNEDAGTAPYVDGIDDGTTPTGDEPIWTSMNVSEPNPNSESGDLYDVNDMWGLSGDITGEFQIFALLHGGIVKIIDHMGEKIRIEPTNLEEKIVLNAIWAESEHSIIVAGAGGVIRRYTCMGTTCFWQNLDIPVISGGGTYQDIWGTSDEDVYVVGLKGAIHHYDGTSWLAVQSDGQPLTDKDLNAVWGFSGGQVFVVGDGVVLHRVQDGQEWKWQMKEIDYDLRNVHGLHPTDMYAVGAQGAVVNYDGNSKNNWKSVELNAAQSFNAIFILDQEHIYIGGWNATIFLGDGASFEYQSPKTAAQEASWLPSTLQVYEIWGTAPDDLYLLGNDTSLYHYAAQ